MSGIIVVIYVIVGIITIATGGCVNAYVPFWIIYFIARCMRELLTFAAGNERISDIIYGALS
jgi:hypothetical protein